MSGETESVCPVCLARVPARHVARGDEVHLEKRCPTHGEFRAVVWRGPPAFEAWSAAPRPATPPRTHQAGLGCPYDCGLCADHHQQSCCVLLEVTARCNLRCPVCFASAGAAGPDPALEVLVERLAALRAGGAQVNLQLSGGEPTLRDDLPELIARGRALGLTFFQLNTNGLRLARDAAYARRLRDAGLGCVFLQFDGLDDQVHLRLRGARLRAVKDDAVARCAELGLGVVLVATVVPGVNAGQLGDLLRHALAQGPAVRGLHLQPVSYFGRYPRAPADADRITLPEVMRALAEQSGGLVRLEDLRPASAEHPRCSFSATFERTAGGGLRPARAAACCCTPRPGAGAQAARKAVARRWVHPGGEGPAAPAGEGSGTASLDAFLEQAGRRAFSLSGMAFQDAWTLDLQRLRECHVHVAAAGRLVPFCAFNLTSQAGAALHRESRGEPCRCAP